MDAIIKGSVVYSRYIPAAGRCCIGLRTLDGIPATVFFKGQQGAFFTALLRPGDKVEVLYSVIKQENIGKQLAFLKGSEPPDKEYRIQAASLRIDDILLDAEIELERQRAEAALNKINRG